MTWRVGYYQERVNDTHWVICGFDVEKIGKYWTVKDQFSDRILMECAYIGSVKQWFRDGEHLRTKKS